MNATLLVDVQGRRALYMEADSRVVEVLHATTCLPVREIVKMAGHGDGPLATLAGSVDALQPNRMQVHLQACGDCDTCEVALNPIKHGFSSAEEVRAEYGQCETPVEPAGVAETYFSHPAGRPQETGPNHVRPNGIYMVHDNLEVTLSSTIRSFEAVNRFEVKDTSVLRGVEVEIDYERVRAILARALAGSPTILNDVFAEEIRAAVQAAGPPHSRRPRLYHRASCMHCVEYYWGQG